MMKLHAGISMSMAVLALAVAAPSPVLAVDGVIEINQARALAGGVTPGDTPGFPVTLSQTGSYRLTGNLETASRSVSAIIITADGVTVDLNGFTITCTLATSAIPVGCLAAGVQGGSGVSVVNSSTNGVTVKNGVVRNMGQWGVHTGNYSRVEDVQVIDNGSNGIHVGFGSIVSNSLATGNEGSAGIFTGGNCLVMNNVSSQNAGDGFRMDGGGCALIGNVAQLNTLLGIRFFTNPVAGPAGFKDNVLVRNNGGDANLQVGGVRVETGINVCGQNTNC